MRNAPASILAGAVFEQYPILSRFQPDGDCRLEDGGVSSLCRLPGGGARVYYGEIPHVFIPLFPGGSDPGELEDFVQDFVLEHSRFVFQGSLEFTIDYQILYDPKDPSERTAW